MKPWVFALSMLAAIAEIRALPIGEGVERLWLHDNAKRFPRL